MEVCYDEPAPNASERSCAVQAYSQLPRFAASFNNRLQRTVRCAARQIRETIEVGQVIEDYPNDKYGPSCLILGFTQAGRPIHVQCSYASRPLVKIITAYEPDPNEWVDSKQRRN